LEVVDVMPSVAPSRKEMRAGTWTEKKPPEKTPSTQSNDGAGSSGGVKRPHSDSSTPPLEKTASKNPGTLKRRLGRIKRLLFESGWRLFTDATMTSNWIRLRST